LIRRLARRILGEGGPQADPSQVSDLVGADGCPKGVPAAVADALWTYTSSNNPPAEAALVAGTQALVQIAGPIGWLPGAADPQQRATDRPLHRLCALLKERGLAVPDPINASVDWAAWAWRDSDAAVAHAMLRDTPSRIWVSADGLRWDWGNECLVQVGLPTAGRLERARVDKPRFATSQTGPGWTRMLEARKARLIIRGTHETQGRIHCQLATGWAVSNTSDGVEAILGDRSLQVQLDPGWRWTVADSVVQGEGPPGPVRCSFELR